MRVVLDTNVLMSGIFFTGPPGRILAVWTEGHLDLLESRIVEPIPLPADACDDEDDVMFLACAIAGDATCVVSGDRALLRASGYKGIDVVTPRNFLRRFLGE